MASTDARPVPLKNTAYRHYFAIRKNDGSLITTWADADTELSGDGGNYGDATNEATEIETSGTGFVDLTAAEMNYDAVIVKVTVSNAGAMPYVVVLFPEEAGDIRVNITQAVGVNQSSVLIPGTIDTGSFVATENEFEVDDITEATEGHYIGRVIIFTSGDLTGQACTITDYALSGANGHFTVSTLTEPPGNDDTFLIY